MFSISVALEKPLSNQLHYFNICVAQCSFIIFFISKNKQALLILIKHTLNNCEPSEMEPPPLSLNSHGLWVEKVTAPLSSNEANVINNSL